VVLAPISATIENSGVLEAGRIETICTAVPGHHEPGVEDGDPAGLEANNLQEKKAGRTSSRGTEEKLVGIHLSRRFSPEIRAGCEGEGG